MDPSEFPTPTGAQEARARTRNQLAALSLLAGLFSYATGFHAGRGVFMAAFTLSMLSLCSLAEAARGRCRVDVERPRS